MADSDDAFYARVADYIKLANSQLSDSLEPNDVSSSFMYSAARFNAWLSALGWDNAEELAAAKQRTVDYFLAEYRAMLEEQLNDHITNFELYMRPAAEKN